MTTNTTTNLTTNATTNVITRTRLMIDGHVHLYDCYDLELFFRKALENLEHYYQEHYARLDAKENMPCVKVLLLTEGGDNHFFKRFREAGDFGDSSGDSAGDSAGFRFRDMGDGASLALEKDGQVLCYVLRGRQIVTREKLEVLVLASDLEIEDGRPIEAVLNRINEGREPAVLAWGVGKWLFKRGKIIRQLIETYDSPYLLLGDNSGRPSFWPTPNLFKQAKLLNIPIINGSDPLPFKGEETKPGSFGFTARGFFNPREPARSIREILVSPAMDIEFFGRRDGLLSFFRRQGKIYKKKYLKG